MNADVKGAAPDVGYALERSSVRTRGSRDASTPVQD